MDHRFHDAPYWIKGLDLSPHPEGGYYRETYRSGLEIGTCCLGGNYEGVRSVSTAIYYLLQGGEFSAFHRIRSDEIWHFYAGSTLVLHLLADEGGYRQVWLGQTLEAGARPQFRIPAGTWFAAAVKDSKGYALVGCSVAPGFDFADFEMARPDELADRFPDHVRIVRALTRQKD